VCLCLFCRHSAAFFSCQPTLSHRVVLTGCTHGIAAAWLGQSQVDSGSFECVLALRRLVCLACLSPAQARVSVE
jgi:hypothetical protein